MYVGKEQPLIPLKIVKVKDQLGNMNLLRRKSYCQNYSPYTHQEGVEVTLLTRKTKKENGHVSLNG